MRTRFSCSLLILTLFASFVSWGQAAKPQSIPPNGGDFSGSFVAEDARGGVRAGVNFFQIRPADAARGHLHQQLA